MSDLSDFCKAVLEILKMPEEDHPEWFSIHVGLCSNTSVYDDFNGTNTLYELRTIIGNNSYPFNNSPCEYFLEDHYTNPRRLAFLKEHATI